MPFAEDIGVYFTDEGSGEPVVLLHGLGLDHTVWEEQAKALAGEFRVISYDARGCGASRAPASGYDFPDLADELTSLLDFLDVERAHLVGHSRGGGVILTQAFSRPERVASLAFIDSVLRGFPWSEEFTSLVRASAQAAREIGVRRAFDEVWSQGPLFRWVRERRPEVFEQLAEIARGWSGAEWLDDGRYPKQEITDLERLGEVDVPTLVLSGQEDMHDFVEIANMLAWWIPGALQKSLLGVGHFPMLENPHETNIYLRGFLRKAAGAGE